MRFKENIFEAFIINTHRSSNQYCVQKSLIISVLLQIIIYMKWILVEELQVYVQGTIFVQIQPFIYRNVNVNHE